MVIRSARAFAFMSFVQRPNGGNRAAVTTIKPKNYKFTHFTFSVVLARKRSKNSCNDRANECKSKQKKIQNYSWSTINNNPVKIVIAENGKTARPKKSSTAR